MEADLIHNFFLIFLSLNLYFVISTNVITYMNYEFCYGVFIVPMSNLRFHLILAAIFYYVINKSIILIPASY
jgi:hypothetical protein